MNVNPLQQTFTPSEAARRLDTGAHNVRRWAEWHAEHLSQAANPGQDRPRRFTLRDIEVLRSVKALREQGLQTDTINQQLAQITFAIVDTPGPVEGPPDALEAHTALTAPIQALVQALAPFDARLAKLEARRFDVASFAYGVIVAGIFFLLLLMLAVLFRG